MRKISLISMFALLLFLAACGNEDTATEEADNNLSTNRPKEVTLENEAANDKYGELPQFTDVQEGERVVVMETTKGNIHIKLFPEYAPKAVENFVTHAQDGYYDGLTFHRVFNDAGRRPERQWIGGREYLGNPV